MPAAYHKADWEDSDERNRDSVPFPPLPIELVREMIELATLSDRPTAFSLSLVSKVVNSWVTPLIYGTVTLESRETILSFIQGLETAQCAAVDHANRVQSLALHRYAMRQCDWTLSLCRNVKRLLLWPSHFHPVDDTFEGVSLWPQP
ncbi:hypothetical protein K439DRAFT_672409 [Ramaria rubella]|nr:hypothetical protein K439DRAFT_672409 [Ramaria rubella]